MQSGEVGGWEIWRKGLPILRIWLAAHLIVASAIALAVPMPSDESESASGPLLRAIMPGAGVEDALHLGSHLDIRVTGLLANATLTQRFRNDSGHWIEAEYLLPLPHEAAVTELDMVVGERVIRGEIRERAEARAVYDAARKAGKRSALLEQQRPHLFTTRVANIPPGEEITVKVRLVLPVTYRSGEFSLRFPTTVTAPFIPGLIADRADGGEEGAPERNAWLPLNGSGWALPTQAVPDAPLISALQRQSLGGDDAPLNPISLNFQLRPGIDLSNVSSRYHDLDVDRTEGGFDVSLQDGVAEMDRDLVLSWQPRSSELPQAATFLEEYAGEHYGLLMVLPPTVSSTEQTLPRELVLVLDVSGSMQGEPIRQARDSVVFALETLRPDDYFNIVTFNDGHRELFPKPQLATQEALRFAQNYVRNIQANGGTNMLPALAAALTMTTGGEDAEHSPLRQVIFVTDGAVGNESELFSLLEKSNNGARVFTVGIGSAPNSYFMQRAAELGRGASVYIARPSEVAPQLNSLFARIEQPMARDLKVDWPTQVEVFPSPVPDLYAGQPLLQVARLDAAATGELIRVYGRVAGQEWQRQLEVPAANKPSGVARFWARSKLKEILNEGRRGLSSEEVKARALPVAIKYQLASPYTSFVAVEEEPVRPPEANVGGAKVPNVQPQGQAKQSFAMAQGATSGGIKLYLGCFLAFLGLMTYSMNRPEPC